MIVHLMPIQYQNMTYQHSCANVCCLKRIYNIWYKAHTYTKLILEIHIKLTKASLLSSHTQSIERIYEAQTLYQIWYVYILHTSECSVKLHPMLNVTRSDDLDKCICHQGLPLEFISLTVTCF